ncbi:MAG: hypothetical protein ACOYK6_07310 [Chthoniobacterales bacterium]
MIQPISLHSKLAHPNQIATHANYTPSEIEDIQKQLENSDATALRIAAQPKKVERKGYSHSNKRNVYGQHLVYSEMKLEDAPVTAFDAPATT